MKQFRRLLTQFSVVALTVGISASQAWAATCDGVQVSDALPPCAKASNPIYALVATIIQYAGGVLGLIVVLMIVIAGLQYVLSDGNPDITRAAKERIRNALTGLILFIIMYGIMELLLPPDLKVIG